MFNLTFFYSDANGKIGNEVRNLPFSFRGILDSTISDLTKEIELAYNVTVIGILTKEI